MRILQFVSALTLIVMQTPAYSDPWLLLQAPHTRRDLLLDPAGQRLWLSDCSSSLPLHHFSQEDGRIRGEARETLTIESYQVEHIMVLDLSAGEGRIVLSNSISGGQTVVEVTVQPRAAGCLQGQYK